MEKLISEQIVDSILSQDNEAFTDAFNAAIAAKVSDALEVKKVEIASSLITPEMAVEEEVEQVEEAVRLFHPGKKAIIKNIDKHGFAGRENHPPTDGSLNGHTIRITDYGDATGNHGVSSGFGGPRFQAVRGKVLTGKHKGRHFEFIHHELEHAEGMQEEVEQIDEGKYEDSRTHWETNVAPVYKKHGLSPKFAKAVDAHVKIHGDSQVWNYHGSAGGADPHWFDSKKGKVKPLRQKTGYEIDESWEVSNEEAEQIDELKKSTLKSYVKKANREMKKAYDYHQMGQGGRDGTDQNYLKNAYPKALAKYDRRDAGVEKAKQKLAKSDKK
jgi:hypothetical protein